MGWVFDYRGTQFDNYYLYLKLITYLRILAPNVLVVDVFRAGAFHCGP